MFPIPNKPSTRTTNKRRSSSDADIEINKVQPPSPGTCPVNSKSRRKSSARQARLVYFPQIQPVMSGNIVPLNMKNHNSISYPQFLFFPPHELVLNFNLKPDILYTFSLEKNNLINYQIFHIYENAIANININNSLIQFFNYPIDISSFLINGTNRCVITAVPELRFQIRKIIKDLNILIENIKKNSTININILENISYFCPISGNQIINPGKGIDCNHSQCFDLNTFIGYCQSNNKCNCPICSKPIDLHKLVYVSNYFNNNNNLPFTYIDDDYALFNDDL